MATLNPYLNFNGNTEETFTFYKSVFGGDFSDWMRFKDSLHRQKTVRKFRSNMKIILCTYHYP